MELPPALAPWGPALQIFPPEVALSLGPLVRRLAAAIGPLRNPLRSGDGEVDGFDGLSRRGSYERLLASEWLLAEEAPEEFLRRAAVGEHTFLRLARPEPAGSRRSVALFDAGPGQLGSPRIAQIAALIVLARRAEAADARFGWGVLQSPEAPLQTEVTPAGVLQLIHSRTPREPAEAHLDAWSERLGEAKDLEDVWIVGSAGPGLRRASRLEIRDVLEPGVRRLEVALRREGRPAAEVTLELPTDSACVRLLRDPFAAAVAPPSAGLAPDMRPDSNLLFSAYGHRLLAHRLLARTRGGGLLVLPVPNSPKAGRKPPEVRFSSVAGTMLLAAGAEKNRVSALICQTAGLVLADSTAGHPDDSRGQVYLTGLESPPFEVRSRSPLMPIFRFDGRVFALDAAGSLFRLAGGEIHRTERVHERILTARQSWNCILAASTDADGSLRFVMVHKDREIVQVKAFPGLRPTEVFFGYARHHFVKEPVGLAAAGAGNEWDLYWYGVRSHLRTFSGTRAVGVASAPDSQSAGLLLLDEDGRSLSLAGRNWSKRLLTASAAIEQVTVCPTAPCLAYSTVDGEVTIASIQSGTVFARWLPERE